MVVVLKRRLSQSIKVVLQFRVSYDSHLEQKIKVVNEVCHKDG